MVCEAVGAINASPVPSSGWDHPIPAATRGLDIPVSYLNIGANPGKNISDILTYKIVQAKLTKKMSHESTGPYRPDQYGPPQDRGEGLV